MTALQWARATEIFDAALDLPPDERGGFVRLSCDGDLMVQAEVEGLLEADAEVEGGSFLDAGWLPPEMSEVALQKGDVISGRFHIVRSLGEGGMGRVYEAHDSELGVQVALKTLRPEVATNPEVILRFRQEVRIAHRITHPNVCRTFHLDRELKHVGVKGGDPVDLTFITMEYLNGETLQQILKRSGRLPLARALAIARQMADAIEAAHQSGIIHRDIKPGNVMICDQAAGCVGEERAVITDFGLAKFGAATANNDFSAISHTGSAMGTLPYMAPEQLGNGEVTPAADIFAFGAVLFEMVTGVKAFPDSTTWPGAMQRASEDPPSPQELVPDLPAEWVNAILGCLQLDPAERFQSACDVIDALEGSTAAPSYRGASRVAGKRKILHPGKTVSVNPASRYRKLFAAMAGIVVCMTLSWFGFRFYRSKADASVAPGALVYLAPVKNETGEKQLDNVTELVRAGLEQSTHINLLDAARVGDYLQQMTKLPNAVIDQTTAREIAMRAGARRVVFVSVTGSGGKYLLNVDIQQPDNAPARFREHWPSHWDWRSDPNSDNTISPDLLRAVRDASGWIRHTVGESQNDIARLDVPPADVTTSNWQALAEYANGDRLASSQKREDAAIAFQNATVIDPDFALAYARRGGILISLNRSVEGYDAYNHALSADLDHRLTRKERDFIQGIYATDTADYAASEAAFRDYAAFYDKDYLGVFFRAYPMRMMGRFKEAIQILKRARELAPLDGGSDMGLAYNYMLLRDFASAHASIADLQKLDRRDSAAMLSGHLAFLEDRRDDAFKSFATLKDSPDAGERSLAFRLTARLKAEYGDYAGALNELDSGIENDRYRGEGLLEASKLLDRSYLRCRSKEVASCLADIHRAIELNASPNCLIRASAVLGATLADPSANSSTRYVLLSELAILHTKLPPEEYGVIFQLARLRIQGELLLANKKADQALIQFRRADTLDSPITDREYLARALITAASKAPTTIKRDALLEEALVLRGHIATNPQLIWNYSPSYPPGFLGDEMKSSLDLALQLDHRGDVLQQLQTAYHRLRP